MPVTLPALHWTRLCVMTVGLWNKWVQYVLRLVLAVQFRGLALFPYLCIETYILCVGVQDFGEL